MGVWSKQTKLCKPENFLIYKDINPDQLGMTTFIDTNFFEFPVKNIKVFFMIE